MRNRNMRRWLVRVALLLAASAGVLLRPVGPSCPAEDSCQLDYRDGAWHARTVDDRWVPGQGRVVVPTSGWSRVTR